MSKHTHDGDALTFGCPACIERVHGDQFWAEFLQECDRDDPEIGLRAPIAVVFAEYADDQRIVDFMSAIPPAVLSALLIEVGSGDEVVDALMQEAGIRLMKRSAVAA